MLDTGRNLATALAELDKVATDRRASLEDLIALSTARSCVDELFRSCTDELRADPAVAPMWEAISSAIRLQPNRTASKAKNVLSQPDEQVLEFWDAFAPRFAWNFLPMDFLHALYEHWMAERHPQDVAFSRKALSRRLMSAAARSGDWFHTRARPGTLMNATEPLASRVPHWCHDGSDAAIYGLRRSGA